MHYANKYNINIASMTKDSVANTAVLNAPMITTLSNIETTAEDAATLIWELLCVTGVSVEERYVDMHIDTNFYDRTRF